jgi:8-oxo-dGTP diphosphatase
LENIDLCCWFKGMEKKVFLCVDGFYAKNDAIFLLKRNVEPFKGFWACVGGFIESNETPQEALRREFREETGLDVVVGDYISNRFEETSDRIKLILTFRVVAARGEVKLNDESQDCGWFKVLPPNCVYPYDKFLTK